MSYQFSGKTEEVLDELSGFMNDEEYSEFIISKKDGKWIVTADKKSFWSWLLNPSQQSDVLVALFACQAAIQENLQAAGYKNELVLHAALKRTNAVLKQIESSIGGDE